MKFSTIVATAVSAAIAVSGTPIEKREVGGVCLSLLTIILLSVIVPAIVVKSNLKTSSLHSSSYAPAPTQPAPALTTSTSSRHATSCPRPSTTTRAHLRPMARLSTASPGSATAAPSAPARRDVPLALSTSTIRTSLTLVLLSGIP